MFASRRGTTCGLRRRGLRGISMPPAVALYRQSRPRFCTYRSGSICRDELALQGFQCLSLCLGISKEYDKELKRSHDGEEDEGRAATDAFSDDRKCERDDCIHGPVTGIADALPLGSHVVGEDFADVD